jgi:acyl dehydratase
VSRLIAGPPLREPLTDEEIAGLPVYDWDVAAMGQRALPLTFEVTEASIADYCRAVRDTSPLYLDHAVAPPTYAFVCAPPRRHELMHAYGFAAPEEKDVRATPFAKCELFFSRPVRPGDRITSVVRLEDRYERRGSQFLTFGVSAVDEHAQPVVEYTYTVIWRQGPPQPRPAGDDALTRLRPALNAGNGLPTIRKLESQAAIDAYAELTRLWPRPGQSLHSDAAFARRTIFGGTVNLGMATAAYCSQVLEHAFGWAALLRPGARLACKATRPIRAGDAIDVGGRVVERSGGQVRCELWVHNQEGRLCGVGTAAVVLLDG